MATPRILVLYNEPILPLDHPDAASEREILDTIETISRILDDSGFRVARLGVGNDLQVLLDSLQKHRPDAVFNLFEGLANRPFTETVVAGILEWFEIPFTGSGLDTLNLARDKQRTKFMLHGAGLPTAPFFTVDRLPCPACPIAWPVIVKPAAQDASVGIEQGSVVTSQEQLEERVGWVLKRYGGPVLVEQFIRGREFLVSFLDGPADDEGRPTIQMLPAAEILFTDPELWPIYSYEAKWATESREYAATPLKAPVTLPEEWTERIRVIGEKTYRLLNCQDYARLDLRMSPEGEPFILEVNPNPFISSIALINGLEAVGRAHSNFVADLARAALSRGRPRPPRTRKPARRTRRQLQEAS